MRKGTNMRCWASGWRAKAGSNPPAGERLRSRTTGRSVCWKRPPARPLARLSALGIDSSSESQCVSATLAASRRNRLQERAMRMAADYRECIVALDYVEVQPIALYAVVNQQSTGS